MTTPTTQREADERDLVSRAVDAAREALGWAGTIQDRRKAIDLLSAARKAIDQSTRQAAPEAPASEQQGHWEPMGKFAERFVPEAPTAATDQPIGGQVDERVLFEQEANAARFFPRELDFSLTKSPSGRDEYANSHLQSRWEGWQAGRASLTPTAPQAATTASADVSVINYGNPVDNSAATTASARTDEPKIKDGDYSAGAKAMIGAVMPCGTCVTNVYEAYRAGERAALARAPLPAPDAPLSNADADPRYDQLYDKAVMIVRAHNRASISLVQRILTIGYNRAARLLAAMEVAGVVSAEDQNGHRAVIAAAPSPLLPKEDAQ